MDIVKWLREYGWRNGTKTCGDRHDEAADEIELLRKERDRLRETLQELVDWQNGPPLVTYTDGWNKAMEKARAALKDSE
jgi:hypothetical protein